MSDALLPCPFCGALGSTTIVDHLGCRCTGCGAMGPMRVALGDSVHMHPDRARSAWNRRATTAAVPATTVTSDDERMGARPSWEVMHAPMGPSGGGSWDDARRRWAAEASKNAAAQPDSDDHVCRGCGTPWGMRHSETCTNAALPPKEKT